MKASVPFTRTDTPFPPPPAGSERGSEGALLWSACHFLWLALLFQIVFVEEPSGPDRRWAPGMLLRLLARQGRQAKTRRKTNMVRSKRRVVLSHNTTAGRDRRRMPSRSRHLDVETHKKLLCCPPKNSEITPGSRHFSGDTSRDGLGEKRRQTDEFPELHVRRFRRVFQQNLHVALGSG